MCSTLSAYIKLKSFIILQPPTNAFHSIYGRIPNHCVEGGLYICNYTSVYIVQPSVSAVILTQHKLCTVVECHALSMNFI